MTDIIKDFDEVSSVTMMEYLKENPDVERVNADLFRKEFMDIGVVEPTLIAFGGDVFSILKRNFSDEFEVKKIPHYAAYISKENYRRHVLSLQAEFGFR